jgi:HEAT repeat protein
MSSAIEQLIDKAKALVKAGKEEDGRDLLLASGYEAGDEKAIQKAYPALFSVPAELKKNEAKIKSFADKDAKKRIDAGKWLSKEARLSYSLKKKIWMRDPRLTDAVMDALAKEDDPTARKEVAAGLAFLLYRYFPDQRAFGILSGLARDKDKQIRYSVAVGIGHLRHPARYDVLLPMLEDKAAQVRHEACLSVCNNARAGFLTVAEKARLRPALLPLLGDKDQGVRTVCSSALRDCGDRSTIPHLEVAMKKETIATVKDSIKNVIAILKGEKEWK